MNKKERNMQVDTHPTSNSCCLHKLPCTHGTSGTITTCLTTKHKPNTRHHKENGTQSNYASSCEKLIQCIACTCTTCDTSHQKYIYLNYSMLSLYNLIGQLFGHNSLVAKLLMIIYEKNYAVSRGNVHAVRSGYMSIDANLAVSGPQEHCSC